MERLSIRSLPLVRGLGCCGPPSVARVVPTGGSFYFESNNVGENTYSKGTVDGDTWTWNNDGQMNGKPVHGRFTLKRLGQDSASYKFEMASGSDLLATVMEAKQTRQK